MSLKLSLCMISKNEEKFLKDFFLGVKDLVDEIILVDTGSTDRTVEIAKSFGAKVYFEEWNDDFSKPRNESLKHATGDWIIYLDPDEKIAPQDFEKLRSLMNKTKKIAYLMKTRNYIYNTKPLLKLYESNDEYAGMSFNMPYYWVSRKIRLFPNVKGVEFKGEVHELVEESLKKLGIKEEEITIPVHHYNQLDKEKSRHKRFFYMNITRKKVLNEPTNAKAHLELGREYFNLRLYHRAIQMYKKGLKLKGKNDVLSTISQELGVIYLKLKKYLEAEKYLFKSLELRPTNINAANKLLELYTEIKYTEKVKSMSLFIGSIIFALGKYEKVITHYKPFLTIPTIANFDAYYFSIKAYEKLNDKKSAEELKQQFSLKGLPILCYHDVGSSDSDWCIEFEDFKEQILFLKKEGYDFVTLENIDYKKKCVALTFDDGRLSNYEVVFSFLEKNKIKATFLITTDWIEGKNIPLKENYSKFMSWNQLKEISKKGHLIGSHTVTHKDLTLLDDNKIKEEATLSKNVLEEKLGVNIDIFCYPYGHYNSRVEETVQKVGYNKALTTKFSFCDKNSLLMPRIYILRNTRFDTFERLFSV